MEKEGTIQRSTSPMCSLIILVRKKDGTIHFLCVDYHKLRDATHKVAYPYLELMIYKKPFEEQNMFAVSTSLVATGR